MKKTKKLIALAVALIMALALVPVIGGAEGVKRPLTQSEREAEWKEYIP